MDFGSDGEIDEIRSAIRKLCAEFPGPYWQGLEPSGYPEEFVGRLTRDGWLGMLIPESYGGGGASVTDASVVLEEISASGANPSACHAQMYVMGTLLRHGSKEQKERYLPAIAAGELRLQAFGVTEPDAGSDTLQTATRAEKINGGYVINGRKIWTSRVLYSDLMILLARTSPRQEGIRGSAGLSVFIIDLRDTGGRVTMNPIKTMMNHNTAEVLFDGFEIDDDCLIGNEGEGFRYILDGMNAERILIASECVGDGRFFVDRATRYANERIVFGRPIGENQGIQFPIARAHLMIEAASLMRFNAAWMYDQGIRCGAEAASAKLLASEASWAAANACLDTHGGVGFAAEYDIERKFRETRLYQVAPISNNLVLAHVGHHVLGLPRSY
jgi:acyl-CoA dehydrogenase